MVRIDDAEIIRQLAYDIWQREGCPSGREHEHWADANRAFAASHGPEAPAPVSLAAPWDSLEAERNEIDAMRSALWTPETYSPELFGRGPWSEIGTQQANVVDPEPVRRRFQRSTALVPQNDDGRDQHRTASRG